jgi:hypothetical protein
LKQQLLLNGRFDGQIEGFVTLRNIGKYLPQNKASHPIRLKSSTVVAPSVVWEDYMGRQEYLPAIIS